MSNMTTVKTSFALILVFCAVLLQAQDTHMWTGAAGTDWANPANWNVYSNSGSTDSTIIPKDKFVDAFTDVSVEGVLLINTGCNLNFFSNFFINGKAYINGDVIFHDTLSVEGTVLEVQSAGNLELTNNARFLIDVQQCVNRGNISSGAHVILNTAFYNHNTISFNSVVEIDSEAMLLNYGNIELNSALTNHGNISMDGTVTISATGNFLNYGWLFCSETSDINNWGMLNNLDQISINGTVNNHNYFFNNAGAAIINNGLFANEANINNAGEFLNYNEFTDQNNSMIFNFNRLVNYGTLELEGSLNNSGELKNNSTIQSSASIDNSGLIKNEGSFFNNGILNNFNQLENLDVFFNEQEFNNSDSTTNYGTFINTGNIDNAVCAEFYDLGRINSAGTVSNAGFFRLYGHTDYSGEGLFTNQGYLEDFNDVLNYPFLENQGMILHAMEGIHEQAIYGALGVESGMNFQAGTTWYKDINDIDSESGTYDPVLNTFYPALIPGAHNLFTTITDTANGCATVGKVHLLQYSCSDSNEPNNSIGEASLLPPGGVTANEAALCNPLDEDWYRFMVNGNFTNIKIRLYCLPEDYRLEVYDTEEQLMATSDEAATTEELIIINNIQPGEYYVRVSKNGSGDNNYLGYCLKVTESVLPIYDGHTGKLVRPRYEEEHQPVAEFSIYPNPASDFIILNGELSSERARITDVLGKTVWQGSLENRRINISNLPAGTYELVTEGHGLHKRFMIQK